MADVLLTYNTKYGDKFIRTADEATNSVTRLNKSLFDISGANKSLQNSYDSIGKANDKYVKNITIVEKEHENLAETSKELVSDMLDLRDIFSIVGISSGSTAKKIGGLGFTAVSVASKFKYLRMAFEKLGIPMKNFIDVGGQTTKATTGIKAGITALTKRVLNLPPAVWHAVAAFTAFKATGWLIEKFGDRAIKLTAVAESFDRLTMSAGLSSDFLDEFAESADNQLTKAELLIKTNKALAGSTGEFATELGESLPLLLDYARSRSQATGEDVDYLFESAIQGIKKAQPLILDNLGLVVDLDSVYTKYAETLGKTTEQLNGVEKQQAILNQVNKEAIKQIDILGEPVLSNYDKQTAKKNAVSDILDGISLSVQDLLGVFLDIDLYFAKLIGETLTPAISVLKSVFDILAVSLSELFIIFQPIFDFFASIAKLVIAPFEAMARIFARVFKIAISITAPFLRIFNILKPLTAFLNMVTYALKSFADLIIGLIDFLALLGNGIMGLIGNALNPFLKIFQRMENAILRVKDTIDQLTQLLAYGFGMAVASMVNFFAQGAKQILKITADLAQGIADFLIGQSPPPKGPLSKIDVGAKKTFEAWLDGFESVGIRPVQKVAQDVDNALGNIGQMSLPQVEQRLAMLDKALQPFSEQLEIVKARFEAISAPAEAALSAIDRQLDTAIKALTSGDASAKASIQALDAQRASINKNLELQKQQVDFAQIELALAQSKQAEERALLNIQKKRLGGQELTATEKATEKRIKDRQDAQKEKSGKAIESGINDTPGVNPQKSTTNTGSALGDLALQGFADYLNLDVYGEIGEEQQRLATESGRVVEGLTGLPERLANAFDFSDSIMGFLSDAENLVGGFIDNVQAFFIGGEGEQSGLQQFFTDTFGAEGTIAMSLTNFFGEDSTVSGLLTTAGDLFTSFKDRVRGTLTTITNGINGEGDTSLGSVLNAMFGEEGVLNTLLNLGGVLFDEFYTYVFGEEGVFSGVGDALTTLIQTPLLVLMGGIETIVNSFIDLVEGFVNDILSSVGSLVEVIPANLRGPLNGLVDRELSFQRVSFNLPEARNGGIFTGGMLSVGEAGREIIAPANKIGVFPNNFVTAIESLESVLVQGMSIPNANNVSNPTYNNSNTSNTNININQPMNPSSVRQQFSLING